MKPESDDLPIRGTIEIPNLSEEVDVEDLEVCRGMAETCVVHCLYGHLP